MAPSSSTTKRAARLAQKGRGKRVRFQGGTLFPAIVAGVLVVGVGLITYARASQPPADASAPTLTDHWHSAYGFQLCSDTADLALAGDLEVLDSNGFLARNTPLGQTGVHSHDDGVIHWHPYTVNAVGRRAKLGVFSDNYGVDIRDDKLELQTGSLVNLASGTPQPIADDFQTIYEEGESTCNGEDAQLRVVVWTDANDPASAQTYYSNFDDIPFDRNGMAITYAFVPDDVDVVMPPWAADLERLGAVDGAPGDTVVQPGGDTLAPGDSGAPDSTPATPAADDTAPDATTGDDSTPAGATIAADDTTADDTTPATTSDDSAPPTTT